MENTWPDDFREELNQDVIRLASDAHFRSWVFSPTPESEAHWTQYIFLYPDQEEAIRQARLLVLSLQMPHYSIAEDAVSERTARLRQRIRNGSATAGPVRIRPLWHGVVRWAAAAVVLLGLFWWSYHGGNGPISPTATLVESVRPRLPNEQAGTMIEKVTGDDQQRITLPDGSVVRLAPHSMLRYARSFGLITRTVALSGQAFFDVIRNPKKPFFVYTHSVVTRVLGTSFLVRNRTGQPATVTVRTGQVSVYDRAHFTTGRSSNRGLLLTPNQQAVLRVADGTLTRSLVAKPLPLQSIAGPPTDFDDRPLTEVIDALVKTYGIPITYDREQLSQCRVTVTFEKEPFFNQLTLLCKLVDGRYEVTDSSILFYSDGC